MLVSVLRQEEHIEADCATSVTCNEPLLRALCVSRRCVFVGERG